MVVDHLHGATITVPVQVLVVFDSLYSALFRVPSRLPKEEAEGV